MNRKRTRLILALLVFVSIGTSMVLGYVYIQVRKDRDALQDETKKLDKRVALLQRKYAEEKARAAGLVRTKLTLESKSRSLQEELTRLKEEKISALSENEAVLRDLRMKTKSYQETIKKISQEYEEAKRERDFLQDKYTRRVKEYETKVSQLGTEKQALEAEVTTQGRRLERCRSHNASLCVIANELAEQYEKKGVIGSILQKEPLTQLKRVELEDFVQEYQERIDEQKLETREMIAPTTKDG